MGPLVLLVMLLLLGLAAAPLEDRTMEWYNRHEEKITEYSRRGTAAFVTMQILIILNTTHKSVGGKEVPSPYPEFLSLFSFMGLDVVQFVPFDCIYTESSFDHLDALLLESLGES